MSGPWRGRDTITAFDTQYRTRGAGETEAKAEELARILEGGEVVALVGELGAGKTTFIRGIARGLGVVDPLSVKSPSYTLVLAYPGPKPLLHVDAYFMKSPDDLDLCGVDDALMEGQVVVVEWADRVMERLPERRILVSIEHLGAEEREIRITGGKT
jgi:tRNA threonylcarbamoyladenosine biosynthesis protein TsaE